MLRYGKYFCVNLLLTAPTPLLVILSFSAIGRGAAAYSGLADGEWLRWIFCPLALVTILTLYLADGFLGSVPSTPTTKAMVDCDADAPPSLVPVDAAFRPNRMLPHPAAKVVFVLGLVFAILTWLFSASDYPSAPLILVIFAGPALVVFLSILSPARRFSGKDSGGTEMQWTAHDDASLPESGRYHEHLSKPQRKYLHVDWLDHVKALQQKKIDEMGAWNVLPLFAKILLVTTTFLFLSSSFTMVMLESYCWDDFKVTDQLDGFSFIEPLGFAALIVFCCCCFSYWAFGVGLSCTTRAARKEVVDALAPKREAWILERQELCPDDEDSEEQDLRLVVKQLRAELHRLQSRVHALERGEPPIETMVERADVKAAYSREASSHDRGVERSPSEVSV